MHSKTRPAGVRRHAPASAIDTPAKRARERQTRMQTHYIAFLLGVLVGCCSIYWALKGNDLLVTTRQCQVVGPRYAVPHGPWTCGN
jgi:hypothetical protein